MHSCRLIALLAFVACTSSPGSEPAGPPPLPHLTRPGFHLLDVAIPKLRARVNDDAHLLSEDETKKIEAKLEAHETATGQQLVLLTLPRLPTDDLDNFGFTVFNRWQLGRACYDDGVLMTIALAEHKVRIDVGHGLEPAIPDAQASTIIQEMTPQLREAQYGAAITSAFDKLISATAAKPATLIAGCKPK